MAGGKALALLDDVPAKHKFVIASVEGGGGVVVWGICVGAAGEALPEGSLITTQNVRHYAETVEGKSAPYEWTALDVSRWRSRTFLGYHRSDGQVGTRNYWLVVPLVFCENRNVAVLKQAFEEELGYAPPQVYRSQVAKLAGFYKEGRIKEAIAPENERAATGEQARRVFSNVDGIKFLAHEGGCGGTRPDAATLAGLLAGGNLPPNLAGGTNFWLFVQPPPG